MTRAGEGPRFAPASRLQLRDRPASVSPGGGDPVGSRVAEPRPCSMAGLRRVARWAGEGGGEILRDSNREGP